MKNMVETERPQKTWRLRVAYWIRTDTRTQAHARARAPTPTTTPTTTHTHTNTHPHQHAPTYVILNALRRQKWFRKRI